MYNNWQRQGERWELGIYRNGPNMLQAIKIVVYTSFYSAVNILPLLQFDIHKIRMLL